MEVLGEILTFLVLAPVALFAGMLACAIVAEMPEEMVPPVGRALEVLIESAREMACWIWRVVGAK